MSRVMVVDPNPQAAHDVTGVQRFESLEELRKVLGEPLERAYTFIATPPGILKREQVQELASQQIVHNLTSDAAPFDAEGMAFVHKFSRGPYDPANNLAQPRSWSTGLRPGGMAMASSFYDLVLATDDKFMKVLADGQAPDLAEPHWHQRGEITSMALVVGVLLAHRAEQLADPSGLVLIQHKLNVELERIARETGMYDPMPLGANAAHTAEERQKDMDSFRQKAST